MRLLKDGEHFIGNRTMTSGFCLNNLLFQLVVHSVGWVGGNAMGTRRFVLLTYCQPVSGISGRRRLRLADRGHLNFPHVKLISYGGRSFAYSSPSNWNSLPAHLRDNSLSLYLLSATSKPFSFLSTRLAHTAHLGFFLEKRYINSLSLSLLFASMQYGNHAV